MCGRFSLDSPADVIAQVFGVDLLPDLVPRYNVAPTQPVTGIVHDGTARRARWFRWGLVPHWARDPKAGPPLVNARAETAAGKPAFRTAFRERRLIVPASGFYEWRREGKLRHPFHIRRRDGALLAMAGLWERWHGPDGPLDSCAILTTDACAIVSPLHDRMPVLLPPEAWERWLDPAMRDPVELSDLLVPWEGDDLEIVAVSTHVNSSRNEGPACLASP